MEGEHSSRPWITAAAANPARSASKEGAPLVVSFVALFAALGGSSYAAVKITGKDIAKRTITGVNVKNGSLGPKKVKPDSLGGD
jgi:hypothetical protein